MFEAKARAISVFPVPGGPYMRHPFGGLMPTLLKSSGLVSGSSTVSLKILSWSPSPPISEKSTFPGSSLIMLNTIGSTYLGNTRMMVKVTWSSATLAPTTSFDRSILTLTPTTFRVPLEALMISSLWWMYISLSWVISRLIQSSVQLTVVIWVGCQFWWLISFCLELRSVLDRYVDTLADVFLLFLVFVINDLVFLKQLLPLLHPF